MKEKERERGGKEKAIASERDSQRVKGAMDNALKGSWTTHACMVISGLTYHMARAVQVELPKLLYVVLLMLVGPCGRKSLDQAMGPGSCSWTKHSIRDSVHEKRNGHQ
jgi:hypothetical protein